MADSHKILIADDDLVVRHILGAILAEFGFSTETVASGSECLAWFSTRKSAEAPLVLFIDMFLGDMTGTDVIGTLRGQGFFMSVVLLSANPETETETAGLPNSPTVFMEKPFTANKVREILESLQILSGPASSDT